MRALRAHDLDGPSALCGRRDPRSRRGPARTWCGSPCTPPGSGSSTPWSPAACIRCGRSRRSPRAWRWPGWWNRRRRVRAQRRAAGLRLAAGRRLRRNRLGGRRIWSLALPELTERRAGRGAGGQRPHRARRPDPPGRTSRPASRCWCTVRPAGWARRRCASPRRSALRVTAVASTPQRRAAATAAGAHQVYGPDEWLDAVRADGGADVIVDPIGGDVFDASLRALAPEGRLLTLGYVSGRIPSAPANRLLLRNCDVRGVNWGGDDRRAPGAVPIHRGRSGQPAGQRDAPAHHRRVRPRRRRRPRSRRSSTGTLSARRCCSFASPEQWRHERLTRSTVQGRRFRDLFRDNEKAEIHHERSDDDDASSSADDRCGSRPGQLHADVRVDGPRIQSTAARPGAPAHRRCCGRGGQHRSSTHIATTSGR